MKLPTDEEINEKAKIMKNIFTRDEVIKALDEILQHPDILMDAVENENTDTSGTELLELGEKCLLNLEQTIDFNVKENLNILKQLNEKIQENKKLREALEEIAIPNIPTTSEYESQRIAREALKQKE